MANSGVVHATEGRKCPDIVTGPQSVGILVSRAGADDNDDVGDGFMSQLSRTGYLTIGLQRGVSKRVEDGRRRVGHGGSR
jgi:hypothetical protein